MLNHDRIKTLSTVTAPEVFLSHLGSLLVNVKVKMCSFSYEFLDGRSPYFQLGQCYHQLEQRGGKFIRYDYFPKHHIYESESHEPILPVKGSQVKSLQSGIHGFSSSICHQFSYHLHHYISVLYSTFYHQVHATVIQVEKTEMRKKVVGEETCTK